MTDQTTAPTPAPGPAALPDRPTLGAFLITIGISTVLQIVVAAGNHAAPPSLATPEGAGYAVGSVLGAVAVFGVLPYVILLFTVLRRSRRGGGGVYLAALLGWSALLAVIIGIVAIGGQRAALTTEMTRFQAQVTRDREAIAARSAAIAPNLTISPETAGADRRFTVTREAIAEGRRIIADQRALIARMVRDEHARLAALSPEAARGFDTGFAGSRARMDAQINGSVATLDELTATLDFLDRTHDRWSIRNGEWLFQSQDDLDELNRHGDRLRELASQTEALQSQAETARQASQREIDRYTHPDGGKP